jgi:3-dehydroquinate synthetase
MQSDKKNMNAMIKMVLAGKGGKVTIDNNVTNVQILDALKFIAAF